MKHPLLFTAILALAACSSDSDSITSKAQLGTATTVSDDVLQCFDVAVTYTSATFQNHTETLSQTTHSATIDYAAIPSGINYSLTLTPKASLPEKDTYTFTTQTTNRVRVNMEYGKQNRSDERTFTGPTKKMIVARDTLQSFLDNASYSGLNVAVTYKIDDNGSITRE